MSDYIASDLDINDKNAWTTDPRVFGAINKEFDFDLDAAADESNTKCFRYITKEEDALTVDWSELLKHYTTPTVWINPPYGRGFIKNFMDKCVEQKEKGVTSVMLVPATLEAKWLPIADISEIRIITGGRLSFYHPISKKIIAGNARGSMFVIFRPSKMPVSIRLIDRDELLGSV